MLDPVTARMVDSGQLSSKLFWFIL